MQIIKSITIRYFRSIYVLTIEDCKDITVLTGLNDVGKSNVLKALNLFFNRQTDWHVAHNFATDYSVIRREAVKKSIREQQFISISIQFIRGNVLTNSLPPMFTVTRRWDLSTSKGDYKQYNADVYTQMKAYCKKNSFEYSETRTTTYLSRFLNRIEYIYIPAIKDQSVFNTILHMLQTSLLADNKNKTLYQPINAANKALEGELHDLQDDFKVSTGITSKIEIPESFNLKQDMLGVITDVLNSSVSINNRGDGIRAHYIPKILNYIANRSRKNYIWGFEEPENSYEYRRCLQVAHEFENTYCIKNQIFITSHSPAFYYNTNTNKSIKRLCLSNNRTMIYDEDETLDSELGYIDLYKNFAVKIKELEMKQEENKKEIQELEDNLQEYQIPLLLTEGKTDAMYLKKAIEKLELDAFSNWEIKEICSGETTNNGVLLRFLNDLQTNRVHTNRLVIGMFDRDVSFDVTVNGQKYNILSEPYIKMGNNIYAFAIPVPHNRPQKDQISIEHYFTDSEIKTEQNGKRLFIGNEFEKTGVYKGDEELFYKAGAKVFNTIKIIEHETNCFVTNHEGNNDYSLSKAIFANNVCTNSNGFTNISFDEFHKIFAVLNDIYQNSIS